VIDDPDEPVSFETDVKPLFRERDRQSMLSAFDLWSHDDVSRHADAILPASGKAPCRATARGPRRRSSFSNAGQKAGRRVEPLPGASR
jgi:hypothetical protein